eukprot:SAG11_NODE_3005_length_2773_cov_7.231488_2_plen_195_part_00
MWVGAGFTAHDFNGSADAGDLVVSVDGGAAQTVTLSSSNAADATSAALVINAAGLVGVSASVDSDGMLVLTSDSVGLLSSVDVMGSSDASVRGLFGGEAVAGAAVDGAVLSAGDAFPLDAAEALDSDNDGVGDGADADDDGDHVADIVDAFPLDPTEVKSEYKRFPFRSCRDCAFPSPPSYCVRTVSVPSVVSD